MIWVVIYLELVLVSYNILMSFFFFYNINIKNYKKVNIYELVKRGCEIIMVW